MKLLADEKFPRLAVEVLRAAGHDVTWVAEDCPSTADPDVLRRAVAQDRVLITRDKDFGELAFRSQLPATSGIALFRVGPNPLRVAALARAALAAVADFAGRFVVVDEHRIRVRPLPKSS